MVNGYKGIDVLHIKGHTARWKGVVVKKGKEGGKLMIECATHQVV